MKIIIIEPYHLDKRYDTRSFSPGIGPVIVGTLLEKAGHEVIVISEYIERLDFKDLIDADLVGISITTYNANRGFEIAKQIRQPIVFGGFHASLMPEECLNYGDYVIRGDGDTLLLLIDWLEGKKNISINEIPNLVFKRDGKVIFNTSQTGAINIIPNYHLVKDYYKSGFKKFLRIPLLVNGSHGCPYNCSFCAIKTVYPDLKVQDKAVVIDAIKAQLKEYSIWTRFFPRILWITDDNFFANKSWAKEILVEISKIRTGYKFVIQARPDVARDDEMLALMKRAGIGVVFLGIESLNAKSLKALNKETSLDDIKFAVKRIQAHGMIVHGLFVFGDDEFQKGDSRSVVAFARKYNLSGVLIQPLTPYPGTDLFKRLKIEGRIIHEDWQYYNGNVVFNPRKLTAAELQKEIYDCYREVFSLSRVIRFLLFGPWGLKLAGLGEAWLRHLEWRRRKHYITDKLVGWSSKVSSSNFH